MTATTYTYALLDPDDPTSRTRIGHAKNLGMPIHFAEEGEYWAPAQLAGGAKVIFADGSSVTLTGVQASSLTAADFIGLPSPMPVEAPKDDWLL